MANRINTSQHYFVGWDPNLPNTADEEQQINNLEKACFRLNYDQVLRTSFFQAAFSASVSDPHLKAFYQRKRAQGKPHQVALRHLMRILTRRRVAVLRSGQPYDPNYHQQLLKKAA
jgi:hypothetical protein